ncbi:MAG: winged helix-turn-helix domain-containing protein [Proteobacteria bacterium]|nr:winged helix-turn-helix domain-containing protein [Pseudomonadota bacterium]MBU1687243.1 winged helix-turn-helix domain-containing protein [Pseudomonadota bacterium]
MQECQHILVVEDDRRLAELIRDYLQQQGYQAAVERRGDRAVQRILHERPALVVLDLMLPGKDGLTVLQQIRADFNGAVLILTAREDDMDQVAGLEMGADDYVKKPVEPRVLLARIRALLRRSSRSADGLPQEPVESSDPELNLGELLMSRTAHRVTLAGQDVEVTTGEFELLWLLAANAGTVLDRDTIFRVLRGFDYDGSDRSVDVAVSRLRKKLGDDSSSPRRIKTIWGKGYLLVKDAW